ncbi:MAG: tetratricopeptide repeat protein [gamma proteobacterium symbiont of Bathyaustriella thionipta]|nr:tetratricopeptide repeat protein [gamma proteobacterium symbiont of Bathyaustriella thionipta]MCU7948931.1 tetratricopeptide repeat protein [gamma proteobacterium symbiont of Bathyaustriella thionipta]MCU7954320.1 tetratricopeptide repeat protein [gamma proteobacterium symbiont of Bathyaustriella thionipta]MCU7955638.1 tetratricopeptide repeat protein [gamma proteobacterium symbiont of Bathyaustriella thionipta]MCU7965597.1 tetratricopeptide repeat protein [gamma proteobacterium symbiont of 
MSVINQMLRDLEERKLKEVASEHYIDEVNIVARKTMSPWWILLPFIIIIVVAINLSLHFLNNNKRDATPTEPPAIITQNKALSIVPDLPENLSEIKPQTRSHFVDSKETHITINKMIPPINKETIIEKSKAQTIEKAEKKAIIVTDNVESKTKIEINQQLPVKTVMTQPVKNNSPARKQIIKEKVPVKVSSVNVKVKSPVKNQTKTSKIKSSVTTEKLIYQARLLMSDNQIEAIELLENNSKKISPDADYFSLLANLYQRRQNYDNAIVYYRKALEIAPNKGEIWIGLALAYQTTGEEDNAAAAFKQALTKDDLSLKLRAYAREQIGR